MSDDAPGSNTEKKNAKLAVNLAALAIGMVMLSFASVPLYRLFCQVTGFGGTTQRAEAAPGELTDRVITIRFNADVMPGLPWDFAPGEKEIKVRVGENRLTYYTAHNRVPRAVAGHAIYNVLPETAGVHFAKIECFCFTDQTLAANQNVHMPISFFVDPGFIDDPEMANVSTITLSYTFFPATSITPPQ